MEMGMKHREWEGMELKKTFPLISRIRSSWSWWRFQGHWFRDQGQRQNVPKMHFSGGGVSKTAI